jgi:hypothetical protein
MFANPIWSLLLLAAPALLYWFVIRPRLEAKFTDLYSHLDSFWARVWARTYAFRTFWIATFGAVITALPDLLVKVSSLDFSSLPQPWPMYVSIGTTLVITLMKAFETKPANEQA